MIEVTLIIGILGLLAGIFSWLVKLNREVGEVKKEFNGKLKAIKDSEDSSNKTELYLKRMTDHQDRLMNLWESWIELITKKK